MLAYALLVVLLVLSHCWLRQFQAGIWELLRAWSVLKKWQELMVGKLREALELDWRRNWGAWRALLEWMADFS